MLTELDADFEGDAHFPPFDRRLWHETAREAHAASAACPFSYAYVTYERR
jgi:dihydrofolate reductase